MSWDGTLATQILHEKMNAALLEYRERLFKSDMALDGYPIPGAVANAQPWKSDDEKIKYVPLQVKQGDLAVFLQGGAYEVMYQGEKYFIVPQSSILMIEREEF